MTEAREGDIMRRREDGPQGQSHAYNGSCPALRCVFVARPIDCAKVLAAISELRTACLRHSLADDGLPGYDHRPSDDEAETNASAALLTELGIEP